ncbi:thermostable beta-glucosidase B [Verticillium alfalfae VaMs.102]|uniref:beta-glucosidase n=1 Tax=Verticillium alfalfae (strain VaMs.102 / ATCC MYA-4576 / FGSC 10136) TaxID=526221 RepID=C9SDR3_VERA1|nr:thermostable beta-glucosidase B [Verticillium alfalfae VaMs.102]EEY17183.1 thermostable beta-glucosidase B [Verticillium alfalfae VaMs.102]
MEDLRICFQDCEGRLTIREDVIDKSAIRVLDLARRLGRFENPEEPPKRAVEDAAREGFIKESGADGITLLKNQGDVLPIKRGSTVALVGQHSWSVVLGGGGSARVDALHAISPIQGFRNLGFTNLEARGVPVFGAVPHADPSIVFPRDRKTGSSRPVKLEWPNGPIVGTNLAHKGTIPQAEYMTKEKRPEYLDEDFSTRITFDLRHLEKRVHQRLEKGRRYGITLESWACDPAILNAGPIFGKMFQGSAVRFHEAIDVAARRAEAAEAAAAADYAVVCVGTTNETETEGFDRDTLAAQYDLAWFPGQETEHALEAVLAGVVNPSGRLPLSWPRRVEDGSSFENFPAGENSLLRYDERLDVGCRRHNRPGNPAALFPFDFGLSYTTFAVTGAAVLGSSALKSANDSIRVSAEVVNAGSRRGKVVVQFYVAFPEGAGTPGRQRPVKELQAFTKVDIEAGQTAQTTVQSGKFAVSVYDEAKARWVTPDGEYRMLVGLSSVDIQQTASFSVSKSFTWTSV